MLRRKGGSHCSSLWPVCSFIAKQFINLWKAIMGANLKQPISTFFLQLVIDFTNLRTGSFLDWRPCRVKARTLWETHKIWNKIFLMVLTNQLIYLVIVKIMRKIFPNHVCFSVQTLQDKICNTTSGIENKIRFHVTLKLKFLSVFQFSLMQKLCIAWVWQYRLWCFSSSGIQNSKDFFWFGMMAIL